MLFGKRFVSIFYRIDSNLLASHSFNHKIAYLKVEKMRVEVSQSIQRSVVLTETAQYLIETGHAYAYAFEEALCELASFKREQ